MNIRIAVFVRTHLTGPRQSVPHTQTLDCTLLQGAHCQEHQTAHVTSLVWLEIERMVNRNTRATSGVLCRNCGRRGRRRSCAWTSRLDVDVPLWCFGLRVRFMRPARSCQSDFRSLGRSPHKTSSISVDLFNSIIGRRERKRVENSGRRK